MAVLCFAALQLQLGYGELEQRFFFCLFVFFCCILYDLYVFILYPCKHNSTLHISISQTEIKSIILYLSFFLLFFYLSFLYTSVTFYFAKCIVQIYALPDDCVQIIHISSAV